ncbi:hypothetical protein PG988_003673 [Apiospora saccharicola]
MLLRLACLSFLALASAAPANDVLKFPDSSHARLTAAPICPGRPATAPELIVHNLAYRSSEDPPPTSAAPAPRLPTSSPSASTLRSARLWWDRECVVWMKQGTRHGPQQVESSTPPIPPIPPMPNDVQVELSADIRGLSSGVKDEMSALTTELDHQLRYLEMRRGVRESNDLWVLTILASVFLPLSLASSILSMGTRLVDLGTLLYDFCGVAVILGSLSIAIIKLVRIGIGVREWFADVRVFRKKQSKLSKMTRSSASIAFSTLQTLAGLSTWAVVFSSFVVGMNGG